MKRSHSPYGIVGEFDGPESLVAAARAAREKGYREVEAYSPYPIKELDDVLPMWNLLPPLVLGAGLVGAATAYWMQWFIAGVVYPTNIGGRPLNSWPSFFVIMFELTVLFAACAAFFGMLFFAGFPAPYHPLFRIPAFKRASDDGFFLCIETSDPRFDKLRAAEFRESL